jgi:HSP20 family protein
MKDDSKLRTIFFFGDAMRSPEPSWKPYADVYRINGGWIIKFDLAGVRLEDVKIAVQGNRVIVKGVRKDCNIDHSWTCYSSEISYTSFERSITLPQDLENSKIELEYRDGILLIRILDHK